MITDEDCESVTLQPASWATAVVELKLILVVAPGSRAVLSMIAA